MTFSSLNTCIVITQLEDLHSAVSSGVPFTLPAWHAWLTTGFRTFQFNCQFVNWNKYPRLVSLCSRMPRKRSENPPKRGRNWPAVQYIISKPTPFTIGRVSLCTPMFLTSKILMIFGWSSFKRTSKSSQERRPALYSMPQRQRQHCDALCFKDQVCHSHRTQTCWDWTL